MPLFQWNATFDTGHPVIDQQHRKLVHLINQLDEAVAIRLDGCFPKGLLQQLTDYTQYHFSTEEALMQQCSSVPKAQALSHREEHAAFIHQLSAFSIETDDESKVQQLLCYLVEWLGNHILITDKEMVSFFNTDACSTHPDVIATADKQLLEALYESEARFRLLADSAPALLWLSDERGERTFFNQTWLDLTGAAKSDVMQDGWEQLIHADERADYQACYNSAHQQQQPYDVEFRIRAKEGGYCWLHEKAVPRTLSNGSFIGMIGSSMDVTVLKEAHQLQQSLNDELHVRVDARTQDLVDKNKQLRAFHLKLQQEKYQQAKLIGQLQDARQHLIQTEKMAAIGHLAAGVAHEINNPIGYVNSNITTLEGYVGDLVRLLDGYASMEGSLEQHPDYAVFCSLKEKISPAYLVGDIKDLIEESKEGLGRVKQIVQGLKDFSRSETNDWQYADIHDCLDTTLNVARNEIKYKAKIIKDYGDLPEVECLPHQLNQVFMNILVNAAQAIEAQGCITLRTRATHGIVTVEITDDGGGIAAENLNNIFNPFFTTKPVGLGTGLGLSISYDIVQQHQGTLTVDSHLGEGTTFKIELPIAPLTR